MGRYSTKIDFDSEERAGKIISKVTGYELHHIRDPYCPFDFYGMKQGKQSCVFEIKTRKISSTTYDSVFLSVRKYFSFVEAANAMKATPIFIFQLLDGVFSIDLEKASLDLKVVHKGNRRDNDPNGIEPMFLFPVSKLKRIK